MCFPSDTRYLYLLIREVRMPLYEIFASLYARGSYASIRSVRIALCERFACFYTKCSHRFMRDVRIALCETFASPYARRSHRLMRDVRIALCERFVSSYTRYSYRLIRDMRSARIEMSVTLGISILSKTGETRYPMQDKPIIQVERRAVKRLCLLKPVLRLHLSELLVFDRAFHNFFVDFLFAVFFNKSRIF